MFEWLAANGDFRREVETEIAYLTKLHGGEALQIAREKAARPNVRTARRKVLQAVVHTLEGPDRPRRGVLGLFG